MSEDEMNLLFELTLTAYGLKEYNRNNQLYTSIMLILICFEYNANSLPQLFI